MPDPHPSEDAVLAAIRAGTPLRYGYDIYGTGRVDFVISWDPEAQRFVEERASEDIGGHKSTDRNPLTDDAAARHVRASRQG